MTDSVFVDTNVLVYWHDASNTANQVRADARITYLAHRRAGRISVQVLQEFYVTLTRKIKPRFDAEEARAIVRDPAVWNPVPVSRPIMEWDRKLQDRHALSWWDALIVAAAQSCACSVLLTEDLQHGQLLGRVWVIDPFMSPERAPAEVMAMLPA